jgi:dTDP-4-dehydrorhamnose 3,5-epimerase
MISGERVTRIIAGVAVRPAATQLDEPGEVCEVFNPARGISDVPLVYVYQAVLRPGKVKGWVYHEQQDDRLFVSLGFLKIVLFDLREDSPTHGLIDEVHLSERNRALLIIPRLVAHAVQNIGNTDALFINLPTRAYNHENPDKYRIAIESGAIPYPQCQG